MCMLVVMLVIDIDDAGCNDDDAGVHCYDIDKYDDDGDYDDDDDGTADCE